ncbi:MAG TPA: diacylglycerol kinase family protein [Candidatus Limnocylindrales bacterium]|nr:diacylglycerol kinase family protein [Candidatus Limnocylindrales bacterium]
MYNPKAGKIRRHGGALIERTIKILEQNGHRVTKVPTTGPRMAGTLARQQIERGADLILAAGGDGTINEIAEGMVHSDVPLGLLPAGTANVLAMEMKMGKSMERVAERLNTYIARRISIGHLTADDGRVSRHFLLMAGIGLDAHIVYNVSAALKARTGKFAYWVAGWSLLGRKLSQMHTEIDGQSRECSFALLSKVRNYGGDFEIAKQVTLFDDRFEVVLFEGRSTLPYVKYFAALALGRLSGVKGVEVLRATDIKLACPGDRRVYVQIDGEYAGHLPAQVRIVPDALTVLAPPEYASRGPAV